VRMKRRHTRRAVIVSGQDHHVTESPRLRVRRMLASSCMHACMSECMIDLDQARSCIKLTLHEKIT
jgi:hypothetical protein